MTLFGLALRIANPTEPKPDPIAFATSPDGKAFTAASSEAWAEATIAAGTKPTTAQSSATPSNPLLHRRVEGLTTSTGCPTTTAPKRQA